MKWIEKTAHVMREFSLNCAASKACQERLGDSRLADHHIRPGLRRYSERDGKFANHLYLRDLPAQGHRPQHKTVGNPFDYVITERFFAIHNLEAVHGSLFRGAHDAVRLY
jgi:hypothetical protein